VKGFFGFGAPKQRLAMQFGYDSRPSFWHGVKCNAHLVIAGVGTAALLSIAGVALWLAMPASERQAFAEPKRPVAAEAAARPENTAVSGQQAAKAAPGTDAVTQQTAAQEAEQPVLSTGDPRWTGAKPQNKAAGAAGAQSGAGQSQEMAFVQPPSQAAVAAAAKAIVADDPDGKSAKAEAPTTSAIPTAKPRQAAAQPDDGTDDEAAAATQAQGTQGKGTPGHIRRAVTLRAGPKKGAAPIGTLQAKTAVQVISCSKWCQVVYKGKTGWIYKTYLDRDG